MNSLFEFPRRVRIHGGESGAVARALHHEAKISNLCQADSRKFLGSTTERKLMSTKTLLKRIALVAVASLGLGLTQTTSANAIQALSFTTDVSSITVVGAEDGTPSNAVIAITVTSDTASTGLAAGESITATVVGVPTTVSAKTLAGNAADLGFTEVMQAADSEIDPVYDGATADTGAGVDSDGVIVGGENTEHFAMSEDLTDDQVDAADIAKSRTYYLAIYNDAAGTVVDQGVYTVRLRLTNAAGLIILNRTIKVDFVSDASVSGATISVTASGVYQENTAGTNDTMALSTQNADRQLKFSLKNRDGGRLVTEAGATPTTGVTAVIVDSATTPVYQAMVVADTGAGTVANEQPDLTANDGLYSLSLADYNGDDGTSVITVTYGESSGTANVTVLNQATVSTVALSTVAAAGALITNATNGADATVPLTTKSVSITANVKVSTVNQTSYAMFYTMSQSGCVDGNLDVEATAVPTKILTNSSGNAVLTINNAFPLDGCAITVTWTGADTNPTSTNVITYSKPKAAIAFNSPGGNYKAVTKSTQTVTWTIVDQFGALMPSAVVQVSHATGPNAPTAAIATKLTDANGQVSYTWTDAAATTASATDTVAISSVNGLTPSSSSGSTAVTFQATLDKVAKLEAKYQADASIAGSPAAVTVDTLVPSTPIGGTAGISLNDADQYDTSKSLLTATPTSGSVTGPWVRLVFSALSSADAAVTGIPTTVKVTNGFLITQTGLIGTERIVYANEAIHILGLNIGTVTVTATNGTLTSSASINFTNNRVFPALYFDNIITSPARTITAVEKDGIITATVRDFYGNAVALVPVEAYASDSSTFANGFNTIVGNQMYTDANGQVRIQVKGAGNVIVALNTVVNPKTLLKAGCGNSSCTVLTNGPAGISQTAPIATSGIADSAALAAEAAVDAALEAIDAANAATDAANLAAEAADAATVAAEEARDAADAATAAIEELSTQFASLLAALKAQLTTLANTVAKIAKKVKA